MNGKIKLITDLATEPVSTAQMKQWLNIDDACTEFDTMIAAMIPAARKMVENLTGFKLGEATFDISFTGFDVELWLEVGGVTTVSSLKYYDGTNVLQTISATNYLTQLVEFPYMIYPAYNYTYPVTYDRWNAVIVNVTTGATAYPAPLLTALKMMVGHWFENRQDVVTGHSANEIPKTSGYLIDIYKLPILR